MAKQSKATKSRRKRNQSINGDAVGGSGRPRWEERRQFCSTAARYEVQARAPPPAPGLAFLEWRYPFKAESRRPRTSLRRQIGRYAGQQAATAGRPGPQQTPPNGGLRQPWHQMEADGSHPFVVARGQGPNGGRGRRRRLKGPPPSRPHLRPSAPIWPTPAQSSCQCCALLLTFRHPATPPPRAILTTPRSAFGQRCRQSIVPCEPTASRGPSPSLQLA